MWSSWFFDCISQPGTRRSFASERPAVSLRNDKMLVLHGNSERHTSLQANDDEPGARQNN
jgi:hypothetical protein